MLPNYCRRQFVLRFTLLALFLVLPASSAAAQTRTTSNSDSNTPKGLSAGAPAGTYSLSDFENVNLYNGNLSFHLPLVHVGGRGGAGYTMMLSLNSKQWSVKSIQNGNTETWTPTKGSWADIEAGYGPGEMRGRHSGFGQKNCPGVSTPIYETTLTTLTFVGTDGTEYDLRDQSNGGQRVNTPTPCPASYPWTGALRGKVWVTADGSSATFISDSDIYDRVDNTNNQRILNPSGYLLLKDGTRYRIDSGQVSWIRDRNGNQVTFGGSAFATDSLGRAVNVATVNPYSVTYEDQITFNGFNGATRMIKVQHDTLDHLLRSDYSGQTLYQLFPQLNGTFGSSGNYNPSLVSAVVLPDNRSYQFQYNSYGELARVVLPTGGAIEYDMASGSGVIQGSNSQEDLYEIYRRVVERRTYANGSTLESKTTYTPAPDGSSVITVNSYDTAGTMLASSKHSFTGNPVATLFQELDWQGSPVNTYPAWNEGKEFKVETYDTNGSAATTLLRTNETAWQAGATMGGFSINPQVASTTSTLSDVSPNLVTKQTFAYDQYNNQSDVSEYDYGSGSAPAYPVRHTHTTFVTSGYDTVNSTAASTIHIRNLPASQTIYAVNQSNGTETQVAQTATSYDESAYSLVVYGAVAGWSDPGTTMRGNATTVSHWLDLTSAMVATHAQYDQCGNVVNTWDAKGKQTQISYSSSYNYGFPSSTTSAVPDSTGVHGSTGSFTSATTYDLASGLVTSTTDQNGVQTTISYNDALDRPTQVIRAANQGTGFKNQTTFSYDDVNHIITTTSDQSAFGDNTLKTQAIYDGLGRTIEARQYETATAYVTTLTNYDALGRAYRSSNPYRSGENLLWTTSHFDALGRVTSLTTPDSAVVGTSYSGNAVTVTDQNGKARKSVSDALGRLTSVYEDPAGLNYLTSYTYDVLGNLRKVDQGGQLRYFMYDSLSRLIRAKNPEQSAYSSISNVTDGITSNNQWSMAYGHDDNGNLTQKTDARGVVSTYAYDALNRNTSVSYSDGTPAVNRYYDGWRDAASQNITGSLGRPWQTETTGTKGSRTTINGFDVLGRPISQSQQFYANNAWSSAYTVARSYNLASGVTAETYPSGRTVAYAYDNAGRETSFTGTLGDGVQKTYASEIIYSSFGSMTKEKLGTDTPVYNKLFYNSRGQLAEIRESSSYTGPTDTTWNRGAIINHYSNNCWGMCGGSTSATAMTDNNGNLKKQDVYVPSTDALENAPYTMWYQGYDYDALNRLQRVHEYTGNTQTDWQQEYAYDRWGNRLINVATDKTYGNGVNSAQMSVSTATNRMYGPGETDASHTQVDYDAAGNQTKDLTASMGAGTRVFDAENRMTVARNINGNDLGNYSYDGDGRRVRRAVSGLPSSLSEVWQVYGMDGELLAEYAASSANTTPQKEYGYRNGQLLITAEASSRQNVALASNGATASASSTYSGFSAAAAIDGNHVGPWSGSEGWNDNTASTFPDWLQVDFNGSKTINEIDVYTLHDNAGSVNTPTETQTFSLYGLTSYDVQYWDGSAWQTLPNGSITGNNKVWKKLTFSSITTNKIRVSTNASVDGYSRIMEVEAWGNDAPAVPVNVAASANGGTASASSTYSGFSAATAIDGNHVGPWSGSQGWNDNTASTFPDWLQVDFNGSKTINEIDVYTLHDNAGSVNTPTETQTFSLYGLTSYDVQYWDGSAWQTLPNGSITGNNKVWKKLTFSSITTSKIRVSTNASADGYSRIVEVEAWTPGSSGSSSGGINWLVTDQLGTPRMIFDQNGSLATTKRHDYAPFGEELFNGARTTTMGYAANDTTRQKFTSKERDNETGLDYFEARYYSPTQGRFTSVDPTLQSMDPTNPQTLNRYTYALNNPLAFIDPDGLDPLFVGRYDKLTDEQKRLFKTYVQKNYADELKNPLFSAEKLWNDSVAVANGDAAAGPNSRLLDDGQLTNFIGVTNMLERRGVIDQVASISEINGDAPEGHTYRIIGELKNNSSAVEAVKKAFPNSIVGKGHGKYSESNREQGLFGAPNGQVSHVPKETGVDVDVDYRCVLCPGHVSKGGLGSDIRVGTHYEDGRKRYGPMPALSRTKEAVRIRSLY